MLKNALLENSNTSKVYLDYAGFCPIRPEALEVLQTEMANMAGNPDSMHSFGRASRTKLIQAKERVLKLLGDVDGDVIFTSSGSESDNLALVGIAEASSSMGRHVLVSAVEHLAVLEAGRVLSKRGYEVEFIKVDKFGRLIISDLIKKVRQDTVLISVMLANNEIGTIQPIAQITDFLRDFARQNNGHRPYFHSDACQAVGQIEVDVKKLGVDAMTFNSAKIGGPVGVGALYLRRGIKVSPVVVGGHQQLGKRAGTVPVPLIMSFVKALEVCISEQPLESVRLSSLRDWFFKELSKSFTAVKVNGDLKSRLPNNIHLSLCGVEGESLVLKLDQAGFGVATGSACSSFDLKPSHVLQAIGLSLEFLHGSLRVTLGRDTTKGKLSLFLQSLLKINSELQALSAVNTLVYEKIAKR